MISPLSVTVQLRAALLEASIGFALWKSNHHIGDALAGNTDLDMLVNRHDQLRFETTLNKLGAIKVLSQPWARYPNVEDWLVFDRTTGGFLHLHVHFDMLTGLKRIKHLQLPWANTVLANLRIDERSGWPTPTAEMELLILLIRIWAKMPPWRRLFAPKIPPHVKEEMRWLESEPNRATRHTRQPPRSQYGYSATAGRRCCKDCAGTTSLRSGQTALPDELVHRPHPGSNAKHPACTHPAVAAEYWSDPIWQDHRRQWRCDCFHWKRRLRKIYRQPVTRAVAAP